jgi:hypothetical protein
MKKARLAPGLSRYDARSITVLAESILDAAGSVLNLAFGLIHLAFGFELRVTDGFADAFLHVAFDVLHAAFDAIVIHDHSPENYASWEWNASPPEGLRLEVSFDEQCSIPLPTMILNLLFSHPAWTEGDTP